jgi:hypothetical protein
MGPNRAGGDVDRDGDQPSNECVFDGGNRPFVPDGPDEDGNRAHYYAFSALVRFGDGPPNQNKILRELLTRG